MYKKLLYLILFGSFMVACSPDDTYDEEYDITYKVAKITGFSPDSAFIDDVITIYGENLDDKTLFISLGPDTMKIVPNSATSSSIKVYIPRTAQKSKISALSYFTQDSRINASSDKEFVPKFPAVVFTYIPDTVFNKGKTLDIKGQNLDLVTQVAIADTILPVTNKSKDLLKLNFSNIKFRKAIVPINFVTRNKDSYADHDLVVMDSLPKIKVLAQVPDSAKAGENVVVIFDKPNFGKFITTVNVEFAKDTVFNTDGSVKKINTGTIAASFTVDVNKIKLSLPIKPLTGNIQIKGMYGMSSKYTLLIKK